MNTQSDYDFFGKESISKILLKVSPPVMLAQLIQALYNIVDSFFVGRYSADALTAVTVIYPMQLIRLFSTSEQVMEIGRIAFPIIGSSFLPAVFSLMLPVFFQAIGKGIPSMFMSLMRQIFLLLPGFKLLSKIGLNYTWFAFPIAEVVSGAIGMMLYFSCIRKWQQESNLII